MFQELVTARGWRHEQEDVNDRWWWCYFGSRTGRWFWLGAEPAHFFDLPLFCEGWRIKVSYLLSCRSCCRCVGSSHPGRGSGSTRPPWERQNLPQGGQRQKCASMFGYFFSNSSGTRDESFRGWQAESVPWSAAAGSRADNLKTDRWR